MVSGEVTMTFLLGSLLTVLEGSAYLAVGGLLGRRRVAGELETPARMFRAWWILIGSNKLASAGAGLGVAAGYFNDRMYVAVIYLNVVVLCLSLWCLISYFAYLRLGPPAIRYWIVALYVAYYFLLTYHITAGQPTGAEVGAWRANLSSGGPPAPPLRQLLILALLALPELVAALSYLFLLRHVSDRTARYRILLVSFGVVAWTASILLVALPFSESSAPIQVTSRLVGIAGALLALLAYLPPRWLRTRIQVESIVGTAR